MREREQSIDTLISMSFIRPYGVSPEYLKNALEKGEILLWMLNPHTGEIRISTRKSSDGKVVFHENLDGEAYDVGYAGLLVQSNNKIDISSHYSKLSKYGIKKKIQDYLEK